jgi:L,D-transpeptidase-like protein
MMLEPTRAIGRKFLLPAVLFTLFTASPRADLATAPAPALPAVTASSVPAALPPAPVPAALAPVPAAVPATQPFAQRADGLSPRVLRAALAAVACARARGVSGRTDLLTLIDYSLPSTEPRLWVLDLAHGKVLFHELVAHGSGSGENLATRFSNTTDSRQTSLGLFLTEGTYEGGNGYSLRLRGLDAGLNDRAEARNIVVHGAPYVSAEFAREHGRLGRSWGCPALSLDKARPVIEAIKGGSFVFSYAQGDAVESASLERCTGATPLRAARAALAASTTPAAVADPAKALQP